MDDLPRKSTWRPLAPHHERKSWNVRLVTWMQVMLWLLVTPAWCSSSSADSEWGDLKGRFVYGGTAELPTRFLRPANMQHSS
ncbi:MAG TPA: hypothetical protein P5307_06525 [Pirellulaceae bacterium]|nr:hypothetical protein [Planctomycetaceae bacterium]HRX78699.1 hypothetical protein [Pirellulaceae bacterium]